MLLPHRSVHPMQQVLPDGLQLSPHALGLRLPFDHEPAAPGPSAVVREAQEVEGLRASLPSSCSSLGGEPPELDQPGLALVERQAELRQPVLERHEKLPRLCLVLAADHQVIRIPTDDDLPCCRPPSPLVNPEIDSVVEEDVCKDRADHPSHDGAKLPFDLAVTIPRDRLRPHYGDGFSGAPLLPCRPSKMRWPDHGGADATAQDKSPNPQGPGEP